MNTELKEEIYQRYTHYLAGNYNEKYIYRLIIQEGYHQNDVDEVMKDIHTDIQRMLRKKNKYRSVISIILYVLGTVVLLAGILLTIVGGFRFGIALCVLAVIIWINANR